MSASPPPLKRPRLSLGDGVTQRIVGEAKPIAIAAAIAKMGTTAAFGGVECNRCVEIINAVLEDRADPLGPDSWDDECFLCKKSGHWCSACPLDGIEDHCLGMYGPRCPPGATMQRPGWFARAMLAEAEWPKATENGQCTAVASLLEQSARAVAVLPVGNFLQEDIAIPPHVAAVEVVPRMPFHLIDRFYYEQPAQLSGAVTAEVHAVAMRRFIACIVHTLHVKWEHSLDVRPEIPLWDVFGDAKLLFPDHLRQRGVFEQKGDFMWDGAESAPRVVDNAGMAFANFARLSRSLVRRGDFEDNDAIVIAGGSVLGAITLNPGVAVTDSAFATSDIDVFVLDGACSDIKPECVAQMALCRIVANYKELYPDGKYAIALREYLKWGDGQNSYGVQRGCVATCFFEGTDLPTVQVIRRQGISSTQELLATFDVDCCGVALYGNRFVASAPAARALARGYNIFNPTFARRATYVDRLRKYARRGFPVFLPLKVDALKKMSSSAAADATRAVAGADHDEVMLRELCEPYVPCGDGSTESLYTAIKIPDGCTTVNALKAAFEDKDDVTIVTIDDFNHPLKCIDTDAGSHFIHMMMERPPIHDTANVCHIPARGFPEHPLLAPIVFPCAFEMFARMKSLKRYNDKWRAKHSSAAASKTLPRGAFVDPVRPVKRAR